jgi:hypothetical protein
MLEILALAIVVLTALFLFGLAAISFFASSYAARFLGGFAGSARAHFLEMLIRIIAGFAFVAYAPNMLYPSAFLLFGWALVVSTIVLLVLPWRWHHRFGQKFVPPIVRHVWLFGIVSLPLGGVILFAVLYGTPA